MKLLILDGNSLINRAFYGIKMLNAPDGTPTNAVYGFLAILQRLLDSESPESICVSFDVHAPTFRHLQYAEYKAGRRPMPEELRVQLPLLKEVLDAMAIPRLELEGWEADDILGTVSLNESRRGNECVVVSGDKDALQLIGEGVRVLHVKTAKGVTETIDYTAERFRAEYGFDAPGMIDLKALMGDSSDNLPGVPGVGEKTAMELMQRFGSLTAVYENLDDPAIKKGVRTRLEAGKASAEMTYGLATIARNAPIDFRAEPWHMPREGAIYELFRRLGFQKFIDKWQLLPSAEVKAQETFTGECESVILRSEARLREILARGEELYFWWEGSLSELVFQSGDTGCYLREDVYEDDYTAALRLLFEGEGSRAGHNCKALLRALYERGLTPGDFVFDSALCAYLLDATAGSYELSRLTMKYCGFSPFTAETAPTQSSLFDEGDKSENEAIRISELLSRAASVAALEEKLLPLLRAQEMLPLFNDIEMPLCRVLADMEYRGFPVDREALKQYGESLNAGIAEAQQTVWDYAGEEFNINSPKQLGEILFNKLKLPGGKKTKTGWSTAADILEKLRYEYPIVSYILQYRELSKLKSTYADGLLKVIGPDGRIHSSFQMTVTATGRLSSVEPNLQNIPVRKESGALLRKMFIAGEGCTLVDADYSQIELRLLAHISGDANMTAAFLSGEDVHAVTASQVFGIPLERVTAEERHRAKAVNFGIVYGISAYSLSQDLGVFVNEAKSYMDAYLRRFSGVAQYQKDIVEQGRSRGYVETLFHRRRYLPELKASDFPTRSFGERVALNMPIQGTAADIIKLAMVRVFRRLEQEGLRARLILQVHDELIVECPEAECEAVKALLSEEMQNAVHYSVPLKAEAGSGASWADAH